MSSILRKLQGGNLEVFKFGVYVMFPIGWMYYFGTNLDNRFTAADGFWPTKEQSQKIPLEKDEIDRELARMRMADSLRKERGEQEALAAKLAATGVQKRNESSGNGQ